MSFYNIPDLNELVDGMRRAYEAPEDLTTTTSTMMKNASSRRQRPAGQVFEPERTSDATQNAEQSGDTQSNELGGIDTINVDSGTDPNPDSTEPPSDGDDATANDDGGDGDDMGDMGMDDTGDDSGNSMDDGSGGSFDDGTEVPKETPDQAISVQNLQQNMSHFYRILQNTIDTLSSYSAPATTSELQSLYTSSISHLTSAKERLFDLLVTDFLPSNYAYKLRQYIALRHVYSTVLEVLNLHFDILSKETNVDNGK